MAAQCEGMNKKNRISSMWFPISHNNAPITVYICSLVRSGFFFSGRNSGFNLRSGTRWVYKLLLVHDYVFLLCVMWSISSNNVPFELRYHCENMFKVYYTLYSHPFDDVPSKLQCCERHKFIRTNVFKFTISLSNQPVRPPYARSLESSAKKPGSIRPMFDKS